LSEQEARFERDEIFRNTHLENLASAFESVDFKKQGLINNIQFFVMWREFEGLSKQLGVIDNSPVPDSELVQFYEIYEDFNSQYEGISLKDILECRAMIMKKAKAKRSGVDDSGLDLERHLSSHD